MEGMRAEADGYSPSSVSQGQGFGTPRILAHAVAPLQPPHNIASGRARKFLPTAI